MKYLALAGLLIAPSAYAMNAQRTGVNFGTRIRVENDTNTQQTATGTDTQNHNTLAVSPFVGYVAGTYFDLGLAFTSEKATTTDTLQSNGITSSNQEDVELKGASPFARLLFAKYMYLEIGFGVYQSTTKTCQADITGTSSFNGSSNNESHTGTGYGYHAGGGVEIPVGLGWFVTTGVYVRSVVMSEFIDRNTSNKLSNTKTELEFGITQYLQ